MKSEKEVEKLQSFVGRFNDGRFMNQSYRQGIMDALAYVMYDDCLLERVFNNVMKRVGR